MAELKPYTKTWFKDIVAKAEDAKDINPAFTLNLLLDGLRGYIAHLDEVDSHRGARGRCSDKKRLANSGNGKLRWKNKKPQE